MNNKISICIPAYEAKGRGVEFIEDLLNSIDNQTCKDFDVIVSDHSLDLNIYNKAMEYSDKFRISHFFNEEGRGNSSINMNYAIKKSNSDFIKIMHLDDKFCDNKSIEKLLSAINENKNVKWGGFGFNHNYESENTVRRNMVPDINVAFGCPSVSFFLNDKKDLNLFDENLIMINDLEMHNRLNKKYGAPYIIPDICVTIRMHDGQVSNTHLTLEKNEFLYYHKKLKDNG